jgi:predicted MFS family arabinose efflux permease
MSRDLLLVALSMGTWGLGEGLFIYFQPLYLEKMGAAPLSIGFILGAVGVAMTIAHIPAGYLADRIGRRPLMWTAWMVGTLGAWIMALAPTLPVFVAGMLVYAITAFVMSPLNSYVTAARGQWSVGRAITAISAAFNLGAVLGPILGGLIGDQIGLRQIYFYAAGLFVISTTLIFFISSQPVEKRPVHQTRLGLPLNRAYLTYLAVIMLAMFAMALPQPLSSNFLQNVHQLSLEQIGRLGSIASVGIVSLNLALGYLSARRGFLLGQLVTGLFALLLWRGHSLAYFGIGYFCLGGYRVARSLATAQTRHFAPPNQMGLAYGLTETINAAASTIIAPPVAGLLYNLTPAAMYPASLGLITLSILVSARLLPSHSETLPGESARLADQAQV